MAKRKRSEASPALADATPAAEKLLKYQKKQVLARLTAAQKPLIAALRLGAGFERQKHSRRKKTAVQKKDTKALTRLDDEYRALKALDLEKVAEQHVRRTIAKVKSLKDHEALPESVKDIEKVENDQAKLNVLARLYKIVAVKKEVDALIDDLKEIVGSAGGAVKMEKAGKSQSGEKKRKVEESEQEEEEVDIVDLSDEDGVAARLLNARIAAPSSGEESDGSLSDNERPSSIGDSDSDSEDPGADLEAPSDSNASSFGGFSASNSSDNAVTRIAPPSDKSDSDSASSVSLTTTTKPSSKPSAAPTSSTFLPGLSHGNYFSGDESASDLDEKPRKNRRGQRARQKIAEAKYGAKAKHIEVNERKKGWDAKRGAVDTDGKMNRKARREVEKGLKAKGGRGPVISGENAAPLGKNRLGGGDVGHGGRGVSGAGAAGARMEKKGPKKDDTGPLHPSWAAAKAAKESKKLKIDLGGAKTAKKITFD
ncbi:Bud-site selection protein [Didymella exigua CBS 183.55]|uniref:Bud-site selection protein n=1 Tax=Didymella exigua CBS 183.55 TaxID=1150837 RepID=A0A6A5RE82_9PLEO|nr:Bud-site selection protein [Didymella exigua CBS 183.55]KAF1925972.1 Bud-site selection protein [Didymella exigua CBS 183.55]